MKINNILIVSPMEKEIKKLLEARNVKKNFLFVKEEEVTPKALEWADAFVSFNLKSDFDFSQVKWVHSLGAGVDRFLFDKEWKENVLLTRTICSFGQRIAEYCLSYILRDIQFHDEFQQLQVRKKWQQMKPRLLEEQKIIIFGTGEIGQTTAKVLSSFGMEVYGVSLSGKQKQYFYEVFPVESEILPLNKMNYIINTLPLTRQTEKIFDDKIFSQLSQAGFLNVGRGASLDEEALLRALKNQNVKFAVLDVFSNEPLPMENSLWDHPNIRITPHISALTQPDEAVDCFIETLKNMEENKPLNNKVDIKKGY